MNTAHTLEPKLTSPIKSKIIEMSAWVNDLAMKPVFESYASEDFGRSITFANMSGDITLTWDAQNDDKIKAMVKEKMAAGYTFFTMRKVVIDAIQVKRKLGAKGVDSITSLVIDDAEFDKLVKGIDDKAVGDLLRSGSGQLAKRRSPTRALARELITTGRARTPEDVISARQSVAVRPVLGG